MTSNFFKRVYPSGAQLRWTVLAVGCILVLILWTAPFVKADWTAMGRRLSWRMSVPDGWIGGSYDQLITLMESSQSENLRRFYETFIPEVRGRDAALFHLPDLQSMGNDPSSLTTSTMTAIRIDVIPFSGENYELLREESGRRLMFRSYADTLQSEVPPGASVTLIETRHFLVDGCDAYEATFRNDLRPSGSYYTVLLFVLVREGAVHNFTLEVDSSRFSARRNELRGMLRTLRYASSMPNVGAESQEAYQDCMDFYGVRPGHPKYSEVKKVCRDVTKTMEEWKRLKKALCASTPNDAKCVEFRKY